MDTQFFGSCFDPRPPGAIAKEDQLAGAHEAASGKGFDHNIVCLLHRGDTHCPDLQQHLHARAHIQLSPDPSAHNCSFS
jgi:hypothetical protein